jgi:hypothetical protein
VTKFIIKVLRKIEALVIRWQNRIVLKAVASQIAVISPGTVILY